MTENLTIDLPFTEFLTSEDLTQAVDLQSNEKHFYKLLASRLNDIQLVPKKVTVQNIINYSKFNN